MKGLLRLYGSVTGACFGLYCAGCPQVAPVTPPLDAQDAVAPADATMSDEQSACNAMALAGCVVLSDCTRVLHQANTDPRFAHYDLTCLSHALVPGDVRACGASCTVDGR